MQYLQGSFESGSGSLTGSFFDPSSLQFDEHIEISYTKLADHFSAPPHFHSQSKTWVIVFKGAMYFRVDGDEIVLRAGEFLIFSKGVSEEVIRVEPGTESMTIHAPSIKGGDKVLIKGT